MKRRTLLCIALVAAALPLQAQRAGETPEQKTARMAWFDSAKLGIFIHWGIYAVDGVSESWSFYNKYLPYEQYMAQKDGFTAGKYDPACALVAGSELSPEGFDFENHIFTKQYVARVVETLRDRATFVSDFWDAAPYLFVSPEDYAGFGIKAGGPVVAPERVDSRAKVYDDLATAPFLAKDVDKFWKPEWYEYCFEVCQHITGREFGFDDLEVYRGALEVPALEKELEDYIKMREYPMGKVMNSLRLALTGSASGLGIAAIISLIGRKEFARRMTFIANRLGRI